MNFNLDPLKQAQEVIFLCKTTETHHPNLLNNNPVHPLSMQEHLGLLLNLPSSLSTTSLTQLYPLLS